MFPPEHLAWLLEVFAGTFKVFTVEKNFPRYGKNGIWFCYRNLTDREPTMHLLYIMEKILEGRIYTRLFPSLKITIEPQRVYMNCLAVSLKPNIAFYSAR